MNIFIEYACKVNAHIRLYLTVVQIVLWREDPHMVYRFVLTFFEPVGSFQNGKMMKQNV